MSGKGFHKEGKVVGQEGGARGMGKGGGVRGQGSGIYILIKFSTNNLNISILNFYSKNTIYSNSLYKKYGYFKVMQCLP